MGKYSKNKQVEETLQDVQESPSTTSPEDQTHHIISTPSDNKNVSISNPNTEIRLSNTSTEAKQSYQGIHITYPKICSYAAVVKQDLASLTDEVNLLITKGWQPIGGISVLQNGVVLYHFQSMVRYY